MTTLLEFFYSKILRREYPLITIPKKPSYEVPYASSLPPQVCLKLTKDKMEHYGITEETIDQAMIEILSHEYIHLLLWKMKENIAGNIFNKVQGWNTRKQKITWRLWKSKENHEYVWETIEGES